VPPVESGEAVIAQAAALPPLTPATEVSVRRDGIVVDNRDLIATWPEEAIERARAGASPDAPEWPHVRATIDAADVPALSAALTEARRAERAASAHGSGAGLFNLRVANDVPFESVERVLYASALAGYVAPRIVVRSGPSDRMLLWPAAPPAIEDTHAPAPRVRSTPDGIEFRLGKSPLDGCQLRRVSDPAIERCAHRLREEASGAGPVVLELAPELPFARAVAILVPLAAELDGMRVVSRAPLR
jgi:hypothetical protein